MKIYQNKISILNHYLVKLYLNIFNIKFLFFLAKIMQTRIIVLQNDIILIDIVVAILFQILHPPKFNTKYLFIYLFT